MGRQKLEGDPAAERELLGLVDDAHAAPADLAEDAVVAQLVRDRFGYDPRPVRRGHRAVDGAGGDAQ